MKREFGLGCGVVVFAGVVVGLFGWRVTHRSGSLSEAARMRQIYIGLSVYEASNNNQPAPDLDVLSQVVPMGDALTSPLDPFRSVPGPYPPDGSLPSLKAISPVRISDGYLVPHLGLGQIKVPAWSIARQDPAIGILASEWEGSIQTREHFEAEVEGKILRINMDGSAVHVTRSKPGPVPLGMDNDLFLRRADPKF